MREIDEVAELSTGGDEGSSSLAVTILPRDPRAGTSSSTLRPRSHPPSFEGFVEETVVATIAEGVRCTDTSSAHPDPLPPPSEGPSAQPESIPSKRKRKEVVLAADEGPERKKLRTDRDSGFMVSRILAMAKTFAPPRSHILPTTIPSSEPGVPPHSQGPLANPSEPGITPVTGNVGEGDAPPGQLQASPVGEEEQDNFSVEFARLEEEVASDREALARNSPAGSGSPLLGATSDPPGASTSILQSPTPQAGHRSNFQTEGLVGCPLGALSSLVTAGRGPDLGHIQAKDFAELLTGKILQVALQYSSDSVPCSRSRVNVFVYPYCVAHRGRSRIVVSPNLFRICKLKLRSLRTHPQNRRELWPSPRSIASGCTSCPSLIKAHSRAY
jgi:hypothetical protein